MPTGTFDWQINLLHILSVFQRKHSIHAGIIIGSRLVVGQADSAAIKNLQFCLIQIHYLTAGQIPVNNQGGTTVISAYLCIRERVRFSGLIIQPVEFRTIVPVKLQQTVRCLRTEGCHLTVNRFTIYDTEHI